MQPTVDFDPARLARSLLRRRREGALATLVAGDGAPYCSLVNLASHPDGSPILLISRLALHTRNLLADPRVSLMLDERSSGDPLQGARIMLTGTAEPGQPEDIELLRRRYLNAHPAAQQFVDFPDFLFVRIRPGPLHLVAGFGRIVDLAPQQILTDLTGADSLLEAEQGVIDHMNADHLDTMNLYATALLGAAPAQWRCTGCDPEGLDLQSEAGNLRLEFPQRTLTPAALRDMLKQLAGDARSAAKA